MHSAHCVTDHSSVILSNPEGSIRRPAAIPSAIDEIVLCSYATHRLLPLDDAVLQPAFSYARRQFFLRSLLTNCVAMHFKDSRVASDVSRSRERIGHPRSAAAVVPQRHGRADCRACPTALGRPAVNGNLHCCVCRKARRPSSTGQGLRRTGCQEGGAADTIWLAVAELGRSHHIKCSWDVAESTRHPQSLINCRPSDALLVLGPFTRLLNFY